MNELRATLAQAQMLGCDIEVDHERASILIRASGDAQDLAQQLVERKADLLRLLDPDYWHLQRRIELLALGRALGWPGFLMVAGLDAAYESPAGRHSWVVLADVPPRCGGRIPPELAGVFQMPLTRSEGGC